MVYSPVFTFSSGYPLGFLPCAGLRLWALRQFQAFFASTASPPWRTAFSRFAPVVNLGFPVLASVPNRSVKPTRLRRAAYFRSLAAYKPTLFKPCNIQQHLASQAFVRWGFFRVPGCAFGRCASFKLFWPLAPVLPALAASVFVALCVCAAFSVWLLRLTGQSSRPAFGGRLTFVR